MKLQTRILLSIASIMLVVLVVGEGRAYRSAVKAGEAEILAQAEKIRGVLMATRRVYHNQFVDSGIPLNLNTLGFLPAHALGRISADFSNWDSSGFSFNNVTDVPRNPDQLADSLELMAMEYFRQNSSNEVYFKKIVSEDSDPFYLYARPIWVEEYCIQCHGRREDAPPTIRDLYDTAYGYEIGDLRGVMSLKLPTSTLDARVLDSAKSELVSQLIAFITIFIFLSLILRKYLNQPIGELKVAMDIAGGGDFKESTLSPNGELFELTESFNEMVGSIREEVAITAKLEEKFRLLFELATDGIGLLGADNRFYLTNATLRHLLGYKESDLQNLSLVDVLSVSDLPQIETLLRTITESEDRESKSVDIHLVKADGTCLISNVRGTTIILEEKNYVLATFQDVSGKYEDEEKARRFNRSVESANESILMADSNGLIQYVNPAFTELTGYESNEALGKTPRILRSGKQSRQFYQEMWKQIKSGNRWRAELINRRKDGSLYNAELIISPVYDHNNELEGFVSIQRDLTEIKKHQSDLIRTQKLESLGTLAGGLAHDFNNFLTSIMLNIGAIKIDSSIQSNSNIYFDSAEKAVMQAKSITDQLMSFAKGSRPVLEKLEINTLLKDAVEFSNRGNATVAEYNIEDDVWPVNVNEGQISQVLNNLVLNANQAMPDGGKIYISASNFLNSDGEISNLTNGRFVKVLVRDDGEGIKSDALTSIFDPYYTTRKTGTGLGLYSCYTILEKHQGWITVDSTVGKGTTFTFYLPASEMPEDSVAILDVVNGTGKILLMDDDPTIRDGLESILVNLGYSLVSTAHGEEAIVQYTHHRDNDEPFDLVILDLTVPGGMNGADTMKQILSINPSQKVIVSSGYATDPIMANYADHGFAAALPKPYTPEKLSHLVAGVLEGESV